MNKGWSATHAAATDFGAAGIGLGAGAATTALLASGPVGLVAAAGGAVAVGVGDVAYQAFQENWKEDIAQHGVVAGIGTGVKDVGVNTGKDMAHMAEGVGTLAKDGAVAAWHGVQDVGSGIADVAEKVWNWL